MENALRESGLFLFRSKHRMAFCQGREKEEDERGGIQPTRLDDFRLDFIDRLGLVSVLGDEVDACHVIVRPPDNARHSAGYEPARHHQIDAATASI